MKTNLEKFTKKELIGNLDLQKEIIEDLTKERKELLDDLGELLELREVNAKMRDKVAWLEQEIAKQEKEVVELTKALGERWGQLLDVTEHRDQLEDEITKIIALFLEDDPKAAFIQSIVEERNNKGFIS